MKKIYFDMDGTIADLYSVRGWLEKLRAFDPSPYREAKPLLRLCELARVLNTLQARGYELGVISWVSKETNAKYTAEIDRAKRKWLAQHLASVHFDSIVIADYGTPKSTLADKIGILFDDNATVRQEWTDNGGIAYDVNNILEILRELRQG